MSRRENFLWEIFPFVSSQKPKNLEKSVSQKQKQATKTRNWTWNSRKHRYQKRRLVIPRTSNISTHFSSFLAHERSDISHGKDGVWEMRMVWRKNLARLFAKNRYSTGDISFCPQYDHIWTPSRAWYSSRNHDSCDDHLSRMVSSRECLSYSAATRKFTSPATPDFIRLSDICRYRRYLCGTHLEETRGSYMKKRKFRSALPQTSWNTRDPCCRHHLWGHEIRTPTGDSFWYFAFFCDSIPATSALCSPWSVANDPLGLYNDSVNVYAFYHLSNRTPLDIRHSFGIIFECWLLSALAIFLSHAFRVFSRKISHRKGKDVSDFFVGFSRKSSDKMAREKFSRDLRRSCSSFVWDHISSCPVVVIDFSASKI